MFYCRSKIEDCKIVFQKIGFNEIFSTDEAQHYQNPCEIESTQINNYELTTTTVDMGVPFGMPFNTFN